MIKFAFVMTLFVTIQEVQLQRSPYAGSVNRFRLQPVNIVPATSSLPSTGVSSIATQARSNDLTTTSTATTTLQPEKSTSKPEISLPGRFSNEFDLNRNQDQYRDFHHHHHHGDWHDYRAQRNFDYDFYN